MPVWRTGPEGTCITISKAPARASTLTVERVAPLEQGRIHSASEVGSSQAPNSCCAGAAILRLTVMTGMLATALMCFFLSLRCCAG